MKKPLMVAEGFACFWVNNGPILKDLKELQGFLKTATKEQFSHHVNKEKNDFADWVGAVLKNPDCAAALRRAKSKAAALKVIASALKSYR